MRQRKASYNQIQRYHDALVNLKSMSGEAFNQKNFAEAHHVSKEFLRACIYLGLLNKRGLKYYWNSNQTITLYTTDEVCQKAYEINQSYRTNPKVKKNPKIKVTPKKSPAPRKRRKVTPPKKREISILWGMFTIKY